MLRTCGVICLLMVAMAAGAAHQISFVSEFSVENPFHIAVDESGNAYVTGRQGGVLSAAGHISVYSRDGKLLRTLGGADENGVLYIKKPAGLALGGENIYVCDVDRETIAVFSREGKYRGRFGASGSAAKRFKNPEGVFVYSGNLYVADTDNNRIQILGPNGVFLGTVGDRGPEEARLKSPTAVAVDARGNIYAVDADARCVKKYRRDGSYAGKLTGPAKPFSLAMAEDGLFVSDRENCNVTKFSFAGEKLFSFGTMGKGRAQFQELYGIAADGQGNVYAVDRAKSSVQIIAAGRPAGSDMPFSISPPTSVRWLASIPQKAKKLAGDPSSGRLFAVDGDRSEIIVLKGGAPEKTIALADMIPVAVAADPKGFLWIFDEKESQLVKLDAGGQVRLKVGSSGSREGYFAGARDLLFGREGLIYVADTRNDRIQVFNSEGLFLKVFTGAGSDQPLEYPVALAQDEAGRLYVLCGKRKVVVCLDAKGRAVREIGGGPAEPERLDEPVGLAVYGTEVMVLDAGTRRIKVFSAAGKYLREFGAAGNENGDFAEPASLLFTDKGRLLVADPGNGQVLTFQVQYTPSAPSGISAKPGMRVVELAWNAAEEFIVESYRILRRQETETVFREIGTARQTSFRDTTVLPGVKYFYRVSARSAGGNENASFETAAAVPQKYTPPAPADLQARSQEWSVDLTWKMPKTDHIDHYNVYREREGEALVAQPKTEAFSEGGLESDASYTYQVTAVSIDGMESDPVVVNIRTVVAAKPPLEMEIRELSDIFSNTYKIYETEGIGKVRLTNNTRDPIVSLKLAFSIKEFMDFPTDCEVKNLLSGETREIVFKAVFNNRILEVTEDTPVQAELTATYYVNQKPRSSSKSKTVNLYDKHRMMWVNKDRIATFITPKDPVTLEFTRAVITQYPEYAAPLLYAGAVYQTLGAMGMTYLKHPNNPYQITEGQTHLVDYVQYPQETLKRNSGVCTDLVVFYAAALEGLGIRTLLLGTPDHLFLMFAVGPASELGDTTLNNMFAVHDGTVWAPVELTLVGSPFMKAWETGSKTYYEWKKKGLEITDPAAAWNRYKPATLPPTDWRAPVPGRSDVQKRYGDELAKLNRIWLKHLSNRHYDALAGNPKDLHALVQLGIIYGEAGELDKAQSFFEKAEKLSPQNAEIKNNLGNLLYLKGKYDQARKLYEKAGELDPADPYILVNLSNCYLKMKRKEKAQQIFQKAVEKDPEIARRYRTLSLELLGSM